MGRFMAKSSNVDEVGFPKLYLALESRPTGRLFKALTLGQPDSEFATKPELRALYGNPSDRPVWTVLHRFGRYILRSHPALESRDWVYFGDDTLFLMEQSRSLVERFEGPVRCLDLCCGGGGVGLGLPPFEGELLGVDLNSTAIKLAAHTAEAQGLDHYRYECTDVMQGLEGEFDLIFGNPPTLSPGLTGKDVFHATGDDDVLPQMLEKVLQSLSSCGRAIFTFFSEVEEGRDRQWERVGHLLEGRRGFRCFARREYPLGPGRRLRHSALELIPEREDGSLFVPLKSQGIQLAGLAGRRF